MDGQGQSDFFSNLRDGKVESTTCIQYTDYRYRHDMFMIVSCYMYMYMLYVA